MSDDKLRKMVEMARAHMEAGGVNAAGVYYRMIAKQTAGLKTGIERLAQGEALLWEARRAVGQNLLGTAADWYNKAIHADPLAVDYRIEYCVKVLVPMGMYKNALIEAERARKIDPLSSDAWKLLGGVQHLLCDAKASIKAYDMQIALTPNSADAKLDRCTIAMDIADYKTVRELCGQILASDNKDRRADCYHMLAMANYREGKFEQAIELYDKAIDGDCYDKPLAHWNKSLSLHSIGRYREGWAEHEMRGEQITDKSMALIMNRFTKRSKWNNEPPPARIHLHQEMGHGDLIAMLRYVNELERMGYDLSLEVNESMVGLCKRSFPNVNVLPRAVDYPGAIGMPNFDYHVPMLSLPALFKTDIDTVPWRGPYLKPDQSLVTQYDSRIGGRTLAGFPVERPRVGLCWSSGIRLGSSLWLEEYGKRKSIDFGMLRPIFKLALQNDFVSLQVGPERSQLHDPVKDILPEDPTWDDTAALVANLDLVITVDTSIAHLAGALGKPVWLMIHTEGSWHWMTKRLDSPWYPSVRIFRQDKPHEWKHVIERIADELRTRFAVEQTQVIHVSV